MRSFYHYIMKYRGKVQADDASKLADWIFHDHYFPKHATTYHEISDYLELYSPFVNALSVFDELWTIYEQEEKT